MKVAVVTPYHREANAVLENCLASVRDQTWPQCTHFLVADGAPNPLVAAAGVKHITLPSAHGGGGNLARCIGAMTAAAEGFDAIAFLDADNWYRPQHVERLVELQARTGASVCTSARSIHRLDGSVMDVPDGNDGKDFTDTNCLCIFRAGFDLLPLWGQIPPSLGLIGDRVFWAAVKLRLVSCAHSPETTVCYRSSYLLHYQMLGEAPPPDAKRPEAYFEAFERLVNLPSAARTSFLYGVTAGEDPVPPAERGTARLKTITVGTADRRLAIELPDHERSRLTAEDIFGRACYAHPAGAAAPKTILDIGAGVGLSAAYFRLAFPEAALHCVEPDVQAYDCLVRNATVIGNCTTYRAALYNMACSSRIHFDGSGAGSLAPISGRPARIFLLDAATFIDELQVAAFDLVKLDAGGVEVLILLRIRKKLSRTAVVHVRYYSELQRRLIDELLADSHELRRDMKASPAAGRLAYVCR